MTTKQMLLSALMLGTMGNIMLAVEKNKQDRVLTAGSDNKLNNEYIASAISHQYHTALNHVKIIRKLEENIFLAYDTIGNCKKDESVFYDNHKNTLQYIYRDNAVTCGDDTIILDSTNVNDCNRLRNEYEEFKALTFLAKKR